MTSYLLAGGGTAGHVNPMLAMADELRRRDPAAQIVCVGTAEGLESTLVPARGFELVTIPRIPFPRIRGLVSSSKRFIAGWPQAVKTISQLITDRHVDVVIGVGGYSAAPAYAAARKAGIPFVIHEANAKPGLANRWGALRTPYVGVTFEGTPLPHATTVGTPLRKEIETLDIPAARSAAREHFGLEVHRPVLVVTSGSQGARSINTTIAESAADIVAAGYQVLHIVGQNKPEALPSIPGYIALDYCDRMDLALAAANMVVSRAGSATVSELSALGVPAVYVPYPVGNGEQRFNAAGVVKAGGGVMVSDAHFTPAWVNSTLIPLLRDEAALEKMGTQAASVGMRDGTARMMNLIDAALSSA
ncbi:UDP-N-acetylglucosamine--N-acetylmuramyl-(pentapeptide) pyrophosphoryl-undecaprenol N-acetylglucosamine transferase [Aurantimicrobium minutum]|uniref:UDP-N-acetylglucosamine--N-acetylmuramyl- (pentapeptide) pyrophosphoryl-undecaprenol N-acetylglucosamine transferase n=1 Tax=Aurantimicrobium minutum TaxID=708131 RepID=UPI0024070C51|nr:UDP-N-acetylglucosamine--N-acetylmuramyl-(pentapeptide) pyrophosphoryl-undecaprenol N-acetylglucosamine transferase [Aurantimicrobium minutum]MDF9809283.1 UDP-N-acetylglucosamine--N-acetylmuramyl-(pentapeptide) pyrophosphoryl-undecaprenol N-acetylglucosamine transferase [Aurantimicrobium minutum]